MSILECLNEGRLVSRKWEATDFEGRQLLCLYTAMVGDPEARPGSCPSEVCPTWLAYTLPFLDDAVTDAGFGPNWYNLMYRIGLLADKFPKLSIFVYYRMLLLVLTLYYSWALGSVSEKVLEEVEKVRDILYKAIKNNEEPKFPFDIPHSDVAMSITWAVGCPYHLEKALRRATDTCGMYVVSNYKSEHLVHCIVQLLEEECSKL